MDLLARQWALTVSVADAYERVILLFLAMRIGPDGTGEFPPIAELAGYACCNPMTVQRRLTALVNRELLAVPPKLRNRSYELLIPHAVFSQEELAAVNEIRRQWGRPPISPATRPPVARPARVGEASRVGRVRRAG